MTEDTPTPCPSGTSAPAAHPTALPLLSWRAKVELARRGLAPSSRGCKDDPPEVEALRAAASGRFDGLSDLSHCWRLMLIRQALGET
jgi:hypothetical protein